MNKKNELSKVQEHLDETELVESLVELSQIPTEKGSNFSLSDKEKITDVDIRQYIFKDRVKDWAFLIFFSFLTIAFLFLIPILTSRLFSLVIPTLDYLILAQITIAFFLISISSALFTLGGEYIAIRIRTFFDYDYSSTLWLRILQLSTRFFRKIGWGDLIKRMNTTQTIRRTLLGQTLRHLVTAPFSVIYLIPLFYFNISLAWATLAILLLTLLITFIAFKRVASLNQRKLIFEGTLNTKMMDIVLGIAPIRIYGSENAFFSKWEKIFYQYKLIDWKIGRWQSVVSICHSCVFPISLLLIYGLVIYIKINEVQTDTLGEQLKIADFMGFFAAFILFSGAIINSSKAIMQLALLAPAWDQSKELLKEPLESSIIKTNPLNITGEIQVDHVDFKYGSSMDLVLKNVSLYANPGEFIGIVGRSGCGKSTLIRLLIGFDNPENGAIFYDGQDLSTLDLQLVRSQIGIVLQNSTLLEGTIRDNITAGGDYNDSQIIEVLNQVGFAKDLALLPKGLDTVLINRGAALSEGHKQCLLLARAFIGNPKILILDEAFSALDPQTRELISHNLLKMKATKIVITHHLNTLYGADRIYDMDQEKIVNRVL